MLIGVARPVRLGVLLFLGNPFVHVLSPRAKTCKGTNSAIYRNITELRGISKCFVTRMIHV